MNKQTRIMALEVKALDDTTGEFTGYAAVFNNTDYADDVIVPGAFKKTLQERKSRPILWQHIPEWMIGIEAEAAEDLNGLNVKGRLNLEVQKGREAYALLKQAFEMGKPDALGLSIGYDVIQREFKNGIRYLKELKLWEWSLVTIPCNELATPTGVKSMTLKERLNKKSTDALTMQQALSVDDLMRMRWDIEDAFCDVRWNLQDNDASLDDATRINLMDQALSDYHTLMLDWFKRYIALTSTITAQNESVTMDVALTKALSAVREAKKLPETVRALNALLETSEPGSPTQGDSEPQADGLKELGEALTNLETEVTKIGPRT